MIVLGGFLRALDFEGSWAHGLKVEVMTIRRFLLCAMGAEPCPIGLGFRV